MAALDMKTVLAACTIYLVESKCYQFPDVTTSQYYVPIVNFRGVNESIVYSKQNTSDDILINSIILELYSEQPITVSSGEGYKMTRKSQYNKDPNIIILIESLNLDESYTKLFQAILKSYWSPVYLIITARSGNQTCQNGTFSRAFLDNAQDYMNTFWHNHQIVRVIVSFPYICPHKYIIYSGKKPSNKTLYDRTIKVINARNKKELETAVQTNSKFQQLTEGFPLRANIFYRFPTSIDQCDIVDHYQLKNYNHTSGFCGLDGLIMHDFMEHYRYNLTIPNDERCSTYGFVDPDTRNVSGILGCISREELDISFNSRFLVKYLSKDYFYLHYIKVDSLGVVLKKPGTVSLWHYAYNTYNSRITTILSILILILGVQTWVFARLIRKMSNQKPQNMLVYVLNALTCTLFGFPIERTSERFRVLRGTSLLCSIILLALYQGNVNYQFTTRTQYREIKTLQQLYRSQYRLYTSKSIRELLLNSENRNDKHRLSFVQSIRIKNISADMGYILSHPNIGTLARGDDTMIEILQNFTDEYGAPKLYVVEETFHVFYLSYIARSGFMFVEESLRFMMRMLEAGLPSKYYAWTQRTLKVRSVYPTTESEPRRFSATKMKHLRIAFSILAFGYFLSTCSFVVEVKWSKRKVVTSL